MLTLSSDEEASAEAAQDRGAVPSPSSDLGAMQKFSSSQLPGLSSGGQHAFLLRLL